MAEGGDPAYDRALRLLAARPRSRAKLRERLLAAGHALAEVDAALARAERIGYLDDRGYARNRADALARTHAPTAIARKLVADGIATELAEEAVARLGADPAALARSLLEQRFGAGSLDEKAAARAARFLAGRGFDEDLIERLLRRS
jgi:regulatory protein